MVCTQCGTTAADGTAFCPQCGASLSTASAFPPPQPSPIPPSPPAGGSGQFKFEARRWAQTDRIVAIATLVLFISLFLPWFTYKFSFASVSVDGLWHGYMYIVLLLSLAIMVYLVMKAGFSTMPFKLPVPHEQALLIATVINFVLSVISFIDKPGGIGFSGIGWGFGAFVGLAASVVAAAPLGYPAIKARRS